MVPTMKAGVPPTGTGSPKSPSDHSHKMPNNEAEIRQSNKISRTLAAGGNSPRPIGTPCPLATGTEGSKHLWSRDSTRYCFRRPGPIAALAGHRQDDREPNDIPHVPWPFGDLPNVGEAGQEHVDQQRASVSSGRRGSGPGQRSGPRRRMFPATTRARRRRRKTASRRNRSCGKLSVARSRRADSPLSRTAVSSPISRSEVARCRDGSTNLAQWRAPTAIAAPPPG